jgi:hypothetical protein
MTWVRSPWFQNSGLAISASSSAIRSSLTSTSKIPPQLVELAFEEGQNLFLITKHGQGLLELLNIQIGGEARGIPAVPQDFRRRRVVQG